ncbi:CpsD/CapB family tyrosine-protein kinase [Acidicapsa acidisoli]|uniref:CpsD/CapB family tyrosine-protein kinase n=1 Tax=Acidicapsa acidisoli TaxID=1615681 RepID=UPI0021E08DC9|nr:CpsD/CapB family tyrosine-protein kinase [Acidicapsa acidisoli]
MSKHFELLQQLEKEQSLGASPNGASIAPVVSNVGNGLSTWADDESLRLVQQIFLRQTQEPPRVVVFAGIDHGNGCSRICASVAETLAKNAGGRVCLLEANFRSPSLSGLLGVPNHHGFTEALLQNAPIGTYTKLIGRENLWFLSSGTVAIDSPNLLTSDRLKLRVDQLRKEFDFVIIDVPPLTRYSDAVVLGQLSDGLVLIIEADSTRREAAAAVAENLRSVKVPILAAVLNKRTFPIPEKIYSRL